MFLISTTICHPVARQRQPLRDRRARQGSPARCGHRQLRHSFRLVWSPGTIGPLCWLHHETATLVPRVRHGLAVSCVGDPGPLTYKRSRRGRRGDRPRGGARAPPPRTAHESVDWSPYGGDERQFCSPGFDLAVRRAFAHAGGRVPRVPLVGRRPRARPSRSARRLAPRRARDHRRHRAKRHIRQRVALTASRSSGGAGSTARSAVARARRRLSSGCSACPTAARACSTSPRGRASRSRRSGRRPTALLEPIFSAIVATRELRARSREATVPVADRPLGDVRPVDAERRDRPSERPRQPRERTAPRSCRRRPCRRRASGTRARSLRECRALGRSSASSSTPNHGPRVGDPRRRSTATSKIAPRVQRTSFASSCGARWKCMPRSVPAAGSARRCTARARSRDRRPRSRRDTTCARRSRARPRVLELDDDDAGEGGLDEAHRQPRRVPAQVPVHERVSSFEQVTAADAAGRTRAPRTAPRSGGTSR